VKAADDDDQSFIANYFSFTPEGMEEIRPVECRIHYAAAPPAPYSINGAIEGLPDNLSENAFQCYIKDKENKLLLACNWIWDGSGKFMAVFDRPLHPEETLALFIVHFKE